MDQNLHNEYVPSYCIPSIINPMYNWVLLAWLLNPENKYFRHSHITGSVSGSKDGPWLQESSRLPIDSWIF